MFDLPVIQIQNPKSFISKQVHFHLILVKINPFDLQIFRLRPFFNDLKFLLELYVVDSWPKYPNFSNLDHIQYIGYYCLIAKVNCLQTHKSPKVPKLHLSLVISRYQHRSITDKGEICNEILVSNQFPSQTGIHILRMQLINLNLFLQPTHE
jgi:hypothetical protein